MRNSRVTHKQNVPKTARRWSLKGEDYALLRFGFFCQMVEKEAVKGGDKE